MKRAYVFFAAAVLALSLAQLFTDGYIVVLAQTIANKVTTKTVTEPVYEMWSFKPGSCGGLTAETWSDAKGWHPADCLEIATKVAELRDVRNVQVASGPDIPVMLAYSQYEKEFRIARADFEKAQGECRRLLKDGYVHPDILAQCKSTVAGVVPYGLKLKDR